jgi:hypothetical protein
MMQPTSKQRLYASIIALGACVLLMRVASLIAHGSLSIWVTWVSVSLIAEGAVDLAALVFSLRWLASGLETHASTTLRFGAAAAIIHGLRILVFVLGRTGPWVNFDVRPEHHALHHTRWTWTDVWFASIMSILGIIAVLVIWHIRRKRRRGASGP